MEVGVMKGLEKDEEEQKKKLEEEETELRLGLPGNNRKVLIRKRGFSGLSIASPNIETLDDNADHVKPPSKAQVVGWPPVRSFYKNVMTASIKNGTFVKVSMDGVPYLRKLNLGSYKGYRELSDALRDLFIPFAMKNVIVSEGCEYASTYEDKDGDWMLVGDVPWEMFVGSCKRLRMMKGNEAIKTCGTKSHGKVQA